MSSTDGQDGAAPSPSPSPSESPSPSSTTKPSSGTSPASLAALLSAILAGAFMISIGLAFFGIWLSRRRAARFGLIGNDNDSKNSSHNGLTSATVMGSTPRRKLQKMIGAWSTAKLRNVSSSTASSAPLVRQNTSASFPSILPRMLTGNLIFNRRPSFTASPRWSSGGQFMHATHNGSTSWIDEDALHGPKVGRRQRESKRKRIRESWPLMNRAPTLPGLHHTYHGYCQQAEHIEDETMLDNVYQESPGAAEAGCCCQPRSAACPGNRHGVQSALCRASETDDQPPRGCPSTPNSACKVSS
ncbi:hypothetical protein B0T22DRAFT_464574 [Podospora appendiculata]|uniref:Uncharacterized protein n=1 Tax=Podospora appendiculata TaxID=314037 RepID=A0AAE0X4V9_9PEZI|nr:hypothetical protein B0T22DRAFT_464574 [Podospora appendiculata]